MHVVHLHVVKVVHNQLSGRIKTLIGRLEFFFVDWSSSLSGLSKNRGGGVELHNVGWEIVVLDLGRWCSGDWRRTVDPSSIVSVELEELAHAKLILYVLLRR